MPLVAQLQEAAKDAGGAAFRGRTNTGLKRLSGRRAAKILDALVGLGPSAVEPLAALLGHDFALARVLAAIGLGGLGDQHAVEPLNALLADEEQLVREAATAALAKLGRASTPTPKARTPIEPQQEPAAQTRN